MNPTTGVVGSLFDNPILFASGEFDFETGLYYNRARYLDPATPGDLLFVGIRRNAYYNRARYLDPTTGR
jgi:hypothetical protein